MSRLRLLTAGESHGPLLTALLEGLPAGLTVDAAAVDADLARRRHGYGRGGRMKIERDRVRFTGGLRGGETLGSPASILATRDWLDRSVVRQLHYVIEVSRGVVSPNLQHVHEALARCRDRHGGPGDDASRRDLVAVDLGAGVIVRAQRRARERHAGEQAARPGVAEDLGAHGRVRGRLRGASLGPGRDRGARPELDLVIEQGARAVQQAAGQLMNCHDFTTEIKTRLVEKLATILPGDLTGFQFYDCGTAAGLMAGAFTESTVIGTAGDTIGRLDLPEEEKRRLLNNIPVAYAVTEGVEGAYIGTCGMAQDEQRHRRHKRLVNVNHIETFSTEYCLYGASKVGRQRDTCDRAVRRDRSHGAECIDVIGKIGMFGRERCENLDTMPALAKLLAI